LPLPCSSVTLSKM